MSNYNMDIATLDCLSGADKKYNSHGFYERAKIVIAVAAALAMLYASGLPKYNTNAGTNPAVPSQTVNP